MTPLREWRLNYRAVFGAMNEDMARQWESYADASLSPRPTVWELNEAMVTICDSHKHGSTKPTVTNFVNAIIRNRNDQHKKQRQEAIEAKAASIRTIRYASTLAQVWAAICNPKLEGDDRKQLKELAKIERPELCDKNGRLKDEDTYTVKMDEIMRTEREGRKP